MTRLAIIHTTPVTVEPLKALAGEILPGVIELVPVLADEVFKRLLEGDSAGQDAVLSMTLSQLAEKVDLVVLAQASMARVVEGLPRALQGRFLASPRSGMERVKSIHGEKS